MAILSACICVWCTGANQRCQITYVCVLEFLVGDASADTLNDERVGRLSKTSQHELPSFQRSESLMFLTLPLLI